METRRTRPYYLSDAEAARERERTEVMVRGITKGKQAARIGETSGSVAEPRFWSSWKGRIIRAIVLEGLYTKNDILKTTKLEEKQFEQALGELFQTESLVTLVTMEKKERLWVTPKELCNDYRSFFEKLQETLVDWVSQWRKQEKVEPELNHFFLEDRLLYDFSERLIEHANVEVLVTNPYVDRCHISNALMSMSQKGINVKLVARLPPEQPKKEYLSGLSEKGVSITYDSSVHAKQIVVDRRVGIVSSMNFFATSSGGASWEAGLVTIEEKIVESIARSILSKTKG